MLLLLLRGVTPWARVLLLSTLAFAAQHDPVSVCAVLDNPTEFRGKTVAVTGILYGNRHHGWYILDNVATTPCDRLATLGVDLSPVIRLDGYFKDSDIEGGGVDFETDQDSERRMFELQATTEKKPELRLVVTVLGLLRTQGTFEIKRLAGGGYLGSGYGPGGQAPAQLVIKTVVRKVVVPKDRADSQVAAWAGRTLKTPSPR